MYLNAIRSYLHFCKFRKCTTAAVVCVSVCVCVVFFPVQKQRPLLRRVGRTSLIGQPHCGGLAVLEPGAGFSAS